MDVREYRGIRDIVIAEVTDSREAYMTGTVKALSGVQSLGKTTSESSEAHYYDNVAAVIVSAEGSDEYALVVSVLDDPIKALIEGTEYNSEVNALIGTPKRKKYFALGYVATDTNGKDWFFWASKGQFTGGDETHNTADDGTEGTNVEYTFTAVSTLKKFALNSKPCKFVKVSADNYDEDTFFASVQTPDTLTLAVADKCAVNFTTTPVGAIASITVLDNNGIAITPTGNGYYNLSAGTYTYNAIASGYVSQIGVVLTIAVGDVTTGYKTVAVAEFVEVS